MQLTDQKELYNVVMNAPIGICILDGNTLVAEIVNNKFLEVAGKAYEEIHNRFYWDAFAEVREYYEAALTGVVETGEPYYADEVEMVLIRKGIPETIFVTFVYAPVKNENGELTKVAVWVLENTKQVIQRHRVEASNEALSAANEELAILNHELIEARKKIEEGEVALRLAIDAANFGTWFIHSVTREFNTDARLKELFGYYPDEELSIEQALAQITDEYRSLVTEKLEKAIYNGGDYDVSYPVVGLHDNRLRWLRAIGNLKADPSGKFSAFTGVVMDITEQKTDEIRKNDFIGMVSHELKTPLTSLKGYIQILLRKLSKADDDTSTDLLERADGQIVKMSLIINGFLNVSRLESGKIVIEAEVFDMAELIREVKEEFAVTVTSHDLRFDIQRPALVNADRNKIEQVVHNLLSNAIKYSPSGSVITVSCHLGDGVVELSVADHGMGITDSDLRNIFDRFYRVKGSQMSNILGFGIGLYLCKEIISRHDGEIYAESEMDRGSVFTFRLPLVVR
jgi:two-component system sensor histidine kinase VicK